MKIYKFFIELKQKRDPKRLIHICARDQIHAMNLLEADGYLRSQLQLIGIIANATKLQLGDYYSTDMKGNKLK